MLSVSCESWEHISELNISSTAPVISLLCLNTDFDGTALAFYLVREKAFTIRQLFFRFPHRYFDAKRKLLSDCASAKLDTTFRQLSAAYAPTVTTGLNECAGHGTQFTRGLISLICAYGPVYSWYILDTLTYWRYYRTFDRYNSLYKLPLIPLSHRQRQGQTVRWI